MKEKRGPIERDDEVGQHAKEPQNTAAADDGDRQLLDHPLRGFIPGRLVMLRGIDGFRAHEGEVQRHPAVGRDGEREKDEEDDDMMETTPSAVHARGTGIAEAVQRRAP